MASLVMPDSKPNEMRLNLLKDFFEDLLKPGYVNQRIEYLKKLTKKDKDPKTPKARTHPKAQISP